MATLIGEQPGRRLELSNGELGAERKFKVRSDTPTESEYKVIAAADIVYGSTHPADEFANLLAIDFSAEQDDRESFFWIVTVVYSTPEGGVATEQLNPLLRPAEISYDTETTLYFAPGTVDQATGTLTGVYSNSAGEPYNPPPEEEIQIFIANIKRYEMEVFSTSLLSL